MITYQPPVFTREEWQELRQYLQVASDELRALTRQTVSRDTKTKLRSWAGRCDELRTRIEA